MIKYFIVYLFSCLLCFIIFELILGVFDYFIYGQFTGGDTGHNRIYHCFFYSYGYSFDFWYEEVNQRLWEKS